MPFKDIHSSLKSKIQAMITTDMSPEQMDTINDLVKELDDLGTSHEELVTENAKLKDTIVRVVSTQGSGDKPEDGADGSKPKTIEECVAEALNKGGK